MLNVNKNKSVFKRDLNKNTFIKGLFLIYVYGVYKFANTL